MMRMIRTLLLVTFVFAGIALADATDDQLARLLKRFPAADANRDGKLTLEEAQAYQQKRGRKRGAVRIFQADPGWDADRFPDHAICYRTPKEIAKIYASSGNGTRNPIVRYPKPKDGSLRIVGTGHSFMAPGYKTFPLIARAAGFEQPPLVTHTGGGMTGSARYKWEQENGIFQFEGQPTPKLLSSIANAEWDVMMWGPYFLDRPKYYSCWMEFCLKYNPQMKFYLSDAWPQLGQLESIPKSEKELTTETFVRLGEEKRELNAEIIDALNEEYPGKAFVLPTSDAMVLAVRYFHEGKLPGVAGIHSFVGKKERSLWRDQLGHLGPGFGNLEGYVFYATIYGRSPQRIEGNIPFPGPRDYPNQELDRVFREIAWQAVVGNPRSGVKDHNRNGIADDRER